MTAGYIVPGQFCSGSQALEAVEGTWNYIEGAVNTFSFQPIGISFICVEEQLDVSDTNPGWRETAEILAAGRYGILRSRFCSRFGSKKGTPTDPIETIIPYFMLYSIEGVPGRRTVVEHRTEKPLRG